MKKIQQFSPDELIDQLTQRGRPTALFCDGNEDMKFFAFGQEHPLPRPLTIRQNSMPKKRRKPQVQKPRIRLDKEQKAMLEVRY